MKKAVIPKFFGEAQEAAWWDAHRSDIDAEIRQRMTSSSSEVTKVILATSKPASDNDGSTEARNPDGRSQAKA